MGEDTQITLDTAKGADDIRETSTMKYILTVCIAFLCVPRASAAPISWSRTSTNETEVSCYWQKDFPVKGMVHKHALFISTNGAWQTTASLSKASFVSTLDNLLEGRITLSVSELRALATVLNVDIYFTDNPRPILDKVVPERDGGVAAEGI